MLSSRLLVLLVCAVVGLLVVPGAASADPPEHADCGHLEYTATPWGQIRTKGRFGDSFAHTEVCVDEREGRSDSDRSRIGVHFRFEAFHDRFGGGPRILTRCTLTVKVVFGRKVRSLGPFGKLERQEMPQYRSCEPIGYLGIVAVLDSSVRVPEGWNLCKTGITLYASTKFSWYRKDEVVDGSAPQHSTRDHLLDGGVGWPGCSDSYGDVEQYGIVGGRN